MSDKMLCYQCIYRRNIPGNAHISCAKPDETIRGDPWGIKMGWFAYPFCFDPVWMRTNCHNFSPIEEKEGEEK